MNRNFAVVAIAFIFTSIILGAIAAHSLEKIVSPDLILTFEKGVKYMMYSGLGILLIALNENKFSFHLKWFYLLASIGTILFSGNIFLFIFHEQIPSLKVFVHVVPIGGMLMILAWGLILINLIRRS